MVGALGFQSMAAAPPLSPPPPPADEEWEVVFSRFFNLPRPPTSRPTTLRPLPKHKIRSAGTWLTAASPASLLLQRSPSDPLPVLSVAVLGEIYEEHWVSSLHFSWPQVSCVAECPVRGSRVVLMSYRDVSNQIQKFAVRFPSCAAAESFINHVKVCLRCTMDICHQDSDFMCENSSASEFIASNGMHNGFDEESSYDFGTTVPEIPALTINNEEPESHFLDSNIETIFSGHPSSFTDMMTNCSFDSEKEQTIPIEKSNFSSWKEGCPPDPSFHGIQILSSLMLGCNLQVSVVIRHAHLFLWYLAAILFAAIAEADAALLASDMNETSLKALISKYISGSCFHDMLSKIEGVIYELGGDLSL